MSASSSPDPSPAIVHLTPEHPDWPPLWRELPNAPAGITATGNTGLLTSRALAVVGTRGASERGLVVAQQLATSLAAAGWVIVSGLALGIDGAPQRGAQRVGGATIAVKGTRIERTYPWSHGKLRRRIDDHGCVITEQPTGARPYRSNFPKRNRLIAGLAEGVIVVEAPLRSGALSTAYAGLDYNREVFAVPGPVDHGQSAGCHHLLKQGATLVESVADIHQVLAPPRSPTPGTDTGDPVPELPIPGSAARWIWDRIDLEGVALDALAHRWSGSPHAWSEGLLALELAGLSKRLPGGRLARRIWC